MEKLIEHTYGSHIYMKLELDGKIYEVDNYAGTDGEWNTWKTTADSDPVMRERIIDAFKKLY